MFPIVPDPQRNQGVAVPNAADAVLTGTVRKIIPPLGDNPEVIEIVLEGAEPLYCEIRIANTLRTFKGQITALKPGDRVTLSVESS